MTDKPINDGGPAFPLAMKDNYELGHLYAQGVTGMSLRDYFAAHAPADASLYAPKDWKFQEPFPSHDSSDQVAWELRKHAARTVVGRWAYADAMLKARGQ